MSPMVLSKSGRAIRPAYIPFMITLAAGICVRLGPRGGTPLTVLSRVIGRGDSPSFDAGRAAGASV